MNYFENVLETIGFNDTIILEQNYQENENLIYPKPEEIKGYIFIGWDYDIKKVTDDLVIKAIYKKKSYIVEFKTQFGDIIKSDYIIMMLLHILILLPLKDIVLLNGIKILKMSVKM